MSLSDWQTIGQLSIGIQQDWQDRKLSDKDRNVDRKVTDRFRIGAKYKLNDMWTIRGGIYTDPSPVSDKAVSLTNIIDVDMIFYCLGVGYTYKDSRIDFGMLLANNDREAGGVDYSKKSTSYVIGGVCKF